MTVGGDQTDMVVYPYYPGHSRFVADPSLSCRLSAHASIIRMCLGVGARRAYNVATDLIRHVPSLR